MIIVALSGGKASAWCADWAFKNYKKEEIILYFNDTKWEHPDLYRFLDDLENYFGHKITYDTDGRTPEDLFYAQKALANNRMPFCSRILKATRLQKFYRDCDTIIFGIGQEEKHRAQRITEVYRAIAAKNGRSVELKFPLIQEEVKKEHIDRWLESTGILQPYLYSVGFTHNNCSGGCVRAGKKQWKLLYEKLPAVYRDRERVEEEFCKNTGKKYHFMKELSLKEFREMIDSGRA